MPTLACRTPLGLTPACLLLVLGLIAQAVLAAEPTTNEVLRIRALGKEAELVDTEWTTTVSHPEGVEVTYQDAILTAEKVSIDKATTEVRADGWVRLQRGSNYWSSDSLNYNFATKEIKGQTFRTGMAPVFVAGFGLATHPEKNTYWATNAFMTTDDLSEPGHRIKAREVTIKPGEYVEVHGATLYLGKLPVGYLPHLKRNLKRDASHWIATPGYNNRFGAYLLSQYNWTINDQLAGTVHMDYRLKRGFGIGPGLSYDFGKWGKGDFDFYYLNDDDPGRDPQGKTIKDDRQHLNFTYRAHLRTNLTATAVVREQSDFYINRDFFESEYRRNPIPDSYFELNQNWLNYNLNVIARPQINDFFQTVERLPDIQLSAFRQQIANTPIYYDGESSAAYLTYRSITNSHADYDAFRADTYHQLVLPKTFFGWLNATPRTGIRYTHYEEAHGPAGFTSDEDRAVFNTGMELSTKLSRSWNQASSKFLDINQLRHIVEPSVNYVYVPSPSVDPLNLPQFDTEYPSLRLVPIEFPDYNSIDSIDSQNVLRLSLRNKLQTKRQGQVDDLVDWGLYTDWRLDRRHDQDTFADVYSDLELRPRSWLQLISQMRYDVAERHLNLSDNYIMLEPNDVWSYAIGHRYLRDDLGFGPESGHNLLLSRLYFRLNENWALRLAHLINLEKGYLEEQSYSLYRDLRSWTSAITFRVRRDEDGVEDYSVAVTFSLKVQPRYKLGDDKESPSLLLGK